MDTAFVFVTFWDIILPTFMQFNLTLVEKKIPILDI